MLMTLGLLVDPATAADSALDALAAVEEPSSGNLLRSARISSTPVALTALDVTRLTDGWAYPDGSARGQPEVVRLGSDAVVDFDLGENRCIRSLALQTGSRGLVIAEWSTDREEFRPLARFLPVPGTGLHRRSHSLDVQARFVRLRFVSADSFVAISEVEATCGRDDGIAGWRDLPVEMEPPTPPVIQVDDALFRSIGLVCLALGLTAVVLERVLRVESGRRTTLALTGLAAVALVARFNGFLAGVYFPIHQHEFFHYYIGGKFFPELGYFGLYDCSVLADREDAVVSMTEAVPARDLRTKTMRDNAGRCEANFAPARWSTFKHDLDWLRSQMPRAAYLATRADHGFNPSPLWIAIGRPLAESTSLTDSSARWLSRIDAGLVLGALAVVARVFGLRLAALVALFWSTAFPAEPIWVGDAYLRQMWFAALLVGLSALRARHPGLAGALLASSALLRVFPLFFSFGVFGHFAWDLVRRHSIAPAYRRFAAAWIVVAIAGAGSSMVATSRGPDLFIDFGRNAAALESRITSNFMGLRALLTYRASAVLPPEGARSAAAAEEESVAAALRAWHDAMPTRMLLLVPVLAGFSVAVRRVRIEQSAILGSALIPWCLDLSGYYYAFCAAALLLAESWPFVSIGALAMSLLWWLVAWLFLDTGAQYTGCSAVVLGATAILLFAVCRSSPRGEGPVPIPPTTQAEI